MAARYRAIIHTLAKIAREGIVFFIRIYQLLFSSLLGYDCRFSPTCSQYAIEALRCYGIWRGSVMALWRILRCNPWCAGGIDPVKSDKRSSV